VYNVYDKPWRETESVANAIYRPSKNIDKEYGNDFEKALNTKRYAFNLFLLNEFLVLNIVSFWGHIFYVIELFLYFKSFQLYSLPREIEYFIFISKVRFTPTIHQIMK